MKKQIVLSVFCLGFLSFFATLLTFTYRYMWFVTETIPLERALIAFVGAVLFAVGILATQSFTE